jgi:hypothetical protein
MGNISENYISSPNISKSYALIFDKKNVLGYILGDFLHEIISGRCYDHNFLRFSASFGEKIGIFLKKTMLWSIFFKI